MSVTVPTHLWVSLSVRTEQADASRALRYFASLRLLLVFSILSAAVLTIEMNFCSLAGSADFGFTGGAAVVLAEGLLVVLGSGEAVGASAAGAATFAAAGVWFVCPVAACTAALNPLMMAMGAMM